MRSLINSGFTWTVPVGLVMVAVLLVACSESAPPHPSHADTTGVPTRVLRQNADSLYERVVARTDSALRSTSVLMADEVERLRRYLQDDHLLQAQRLGISPIPNRRVAGELASRASQDGTVVSLKTNAYYIVDPRMGYAVPLVVPEAAHVLERIGREYHLRLRSQGLPPYRFILTNILRTGIDQAHLRGSNVNAARGESTHEYGTTFDIYYGRFHYVASRDSIAQAAAAGAKTDEARYGRMLREAYRERGLTQAEQLKGVLGRTLLELQDDGALMVTYERSEPVFHVTIAGVVEAAPDHAPDGEPFYGNAESQMMDIDNDIEEMGEDAADLSGTVRQRMEENLDGLRDLQEDAWRAVDGLDGQSEEARRDVAAKIARLEGQIVRTRIESLEREQSLQAYLRRFVRNADRTLTYIESWSEHTADETAAAHAQQISDLRRLQRDLERVAEGSPPYEEMRTNAAVIAEEMTRGVELLKDRLPLY